MITGDYHHTAIAVARDVGIVASDSRVLVIDAANRPQSCSVQPSASANDSQKSQAFSDHPQAAETTPAVPQQPACTALQLLHASCAAIPSQGTGPCHTHRHEQTHGAGADRLPPKHVRWSQATPSLSPACTEDEQGHPGGGDAGDDLAPVDWQIHAGDEQASVGDQAYPQPAADVASQLPSVHSFAQQEALLPFPAKPIGSKVLGGVDSTTDDSSQPWPGSLPLASITAHHAVLQSQVAARRPSASTIPASTAPAGTTSQQPEAASLRFVTGDDDKEWDAMQALTAVAEGRLQCAVTGEAFQLLLQLPNESALGTVMRNVVVFARMKPHQKGQVMNLLNARGLHHMYAGEPRHIQVYIPSCQVPPPPPLAPADSTPNPSPVPPALLTPPFRSLFGAYSEPMHQRCTICWKAKAPTGIYAPLKSLQSLGNLVAEGAVVSQWLFMLMLQAAVAVVITLSRVFATLCCHN